MPLPFNLIFHTMKFAYTILYVKHVPTTIDFHERAFGFQRKFVMPEQDYGELLSGETTLAFASLELGRSNFPKGFTPISGDRPPVGIELAFTTENIEQDFQQALDAGATVFEAVVQKPWGQKVGYLRDIDGFLIEICTPMK